MTTNIDIKEFIKKKDNANNKILDEKYIALFNKIYNNEIYIIKQNTKIENRNKLDNKIILILNKLTNNNINNIVIEFLKNINKLNIEEFEIFQKIIYNKIISEIRYVDSYLKFFIIVNKIYSDVCNVNNEYFINIIEYSFKVNYCKHILYDKYDFINNTEECRNNNNTLIKKIVEYKILTNEIIDICSDIILHNNKYIIDIYYWFTNLVVTNEQKIYIEKKINEITNMRETTLLKKLL